MAGAAGEGGLALGCSAAAHSRSARVSHSVSARAFRKNFIISKYIEKKYAKRSAAARCPGLPEAVKDKDIFSLLQAYAENVDLSEPVLAPLQVWPLLPWAHGENSFPVASPACPYGSLCPGVD